MSTIHVDVVSAEESIFSGEARFVALPGEAGELGIYPRHTPLITRIKPGSVRIEKADGSEEFVFVAGGILEVSTSVHGGPLTLGDFHIAFFIVAAVSAAASLSFMRLAPDAGSAVSGHGRLTTPKTLEPVSTPGK